MTKLICIKTCKDIFGDDIIININQVVYAPIPMYEYTYISIYRDESGYEYINEFFRGNFITFKRWREIQIDKILK